MDTEVVTIEVYDKRIQMYTTMSVEKLAENRFRTVENEIFNCRLTLGTEFETRINKEGIHEVIRITKDSEFITRRFLLSGGVDTGLLRMIGDELVARGGFWQTDFGGIATVNILPEFENEFNIAMKELGINATEIVDDTNSASGRAV